MEVSDNTVELTPPPSSCHCRQCLCLAFARVRDFGDCSFHTLLSYFHTVLLCLNLHSNLLYWIASNHTSKFAHAAYWLSAFITSPPSLLLLATAACGICYNSYAWLIMSPSVSHSIPFFATLIPGRLTSFWTLNPLLSVPCAPAPGYKWAASGSV